MDGFEMDYTLYRLNDGRKAKEFSIFFFFVEMKTSNE